MKTLSDAVLVLRETAQELEELLHAKLSFGEQSMTLQEAYNRVLSVAGNKYFTIGFEMGPRSLSDHHGPAFFKVYTQSLADNNTFEANTLAEVVNACLAAHRPAPPIAQSIDAAQTLLTAATGSIPATGAGSTEISRG